MKTMRNLSLLVLLSFGLLYSCGHSHGEDTHTHDGDTETHTHSHGEEGHSHNNDHHSHPDEAEIQEARVVEATPNAPEYIQIANNVEVLEHVPTAAKSESSVFTHEGYFGPLLFGEELRSFSLKLEAGMFLSEHPHPTESIVYTISGKWVLCSEGKRKVMEEGSIFHFGSDMPTGWEAPFEGGATVLIFKKIRKDENYESFTTGTRTLSKDLDERYKDGEQFYFHQLKDDHPAIQFAKANNPEFDALLEKIKP